MIKKIASIVIGLVLFLMIAAFVLNLVAPNVMSSIVDSTEDIGCNATHLDWD